MAEEAPHKVTLALDIVVVQNDELPPELSGPNKQCAHFRFTMLGGNRVTTDPVGRGGNWETVKLPESTSDSVTTQTTSRPASAKGKDVKAAGTPTGAAGKAGGAASTPTSSSTTNNATNALKMLRHRTMVSLSVDKSFASRLSTCPCLFVTMGCSPDPEGDTTSSSAAVPATPAAPAGKASAKGAVPAAGAATPAAATNTGGPGSHPFVCFIPLDVSALLSPETPFVGAVYGDVKAAGTALRLASSPVAVEPFAEKPVDDLVAAGLGMSPAAVAQCASGLAAPKLFKFLSVSVSIVSATQSRLVPPPAEGSPGALAAAEEAAAAAAAAAAATPAKGAKGGAPAKGAAPAAAAVVPAGPQMLDVPIIPPTLLNTTLRRELNPLSLTMVSVDSLPGLVLPEGVAATQRKLIEPDVYEVQRKHCRSTYAIVKFPELLVSLSSSSDSLHSSSSSSSFFSSSSSSTSTTSASPAAIDPTLIPRKYKLQDGTLITVPAPRNVTMITPGAPSGAKLLARYTAVICAGSLPLNPLREALKTTPVTVEVHDRDCIDYEAIQEAAAIAVASGTSLMSPRTVSSSSSSSAAPIQAEVAAPVAPAPAAKGGKPAAPAPTPAPAATPATTTTTSTSTATGPTGAEMSKILAAVLPRSWAWPLLTPARLETYEGIANGSIPWPIEEIDPATAAAVAAAAASARPPSAAAAGKALPGKGAAPAAGTTAAPAKTLFDVDALLCSEAMHKISNHAGDAHSHGIASFRLEGLLDRTGEERAALKQKYISPANTTNSSSASSTPTKGDLTPNKTSARRLLLPYEEAIEESIRIRLSAGLASSNRRKKPKIPEPLHKLSYEQSLIIAPVPYGSSGTRVKLVAQIAHPSRLHAEPLAVDKAGNASKPPFERLVFAFEYANDTLLQAVLAAVDRINASALPSSPSIRSHIFTADEILAVESGKLDVITGIHIIDTHKRRIILAEGLGAGYGMGMIKLRNALGLRPGLNTDTYHLLANPAVRFHSRLYTQFNAALKDVRLRAPLDTIVSSPVLYDIQATPASLRNALLALRQLTDTETLSTAKELGSWPSSTGILAVENKYGDTVSLADMYGVGHPAAHALEQTRGRLTETLDLVSGHVEASTQENLLLTMTLGRTNKGGDDSNNTNNNTADFGDSGLLSATQRHARMTRKAGTTASNTDYVASLAAQAKARANADFISANIAAVDSASAKLEMQHYSELAMTVGPEKASALHSLKAGETLDTRDVQPPGGQVFMYSGQALNTGEWQKELMRKRLAQDKAATYTYGREFGSLTVSLVNEQIEQLEEAARSKNAWKTKSGFIYPSIRAREEDLTHPMHPHESRVLDLAQPWADPDYLTAQETARRKAVSTMPGRPAFRDTPCPDPLAPTSGYFGYTDHATGAQRASDYFATVHLCGDGLEAEQEAAKLHQQEEWRRKIVVGTTKFLGFESHDGMARVNRLQSLLRNPPHTKVLKDLNTTGTRIAGTTKRVVLVNPPPNMDTPFPYEPPQRPEFATTRGLLKGTGSRGIPADTLLVGRTADGKVVDFKKVGSNVSGFAKVTHIPHITASILSPNAPVGGKPVVPTMVHGINTDSRAV